MQDLLTHVVKSVSLWANAARKSGATDEQLHATNVWTLRAVFSTLTNVNFSEDRIAQYIQEGMNLKKDLKSLVDSSLVPNGPVAELDLNGKSLQEMEDTSRTISSIPVRLAAMGDEDCFSLNEIATYGARGLCAYAAHCYQLGKLDDDVMKELHEVYCKLSSEEADMEGLLATVMKVGEVNAKVLAMLDNAHADSFGVPIPTDVKMTATEGKAILISGHDMVDLDALLKQTEGTGVNVYTHGEMLPAHGYPGLKKVRVNYIWFVLLDS